MQTTKRPLSFLLAVLMIVGLFAAVPFTASAAATGSYGGLNWTIDDDGVLTFSGSGAIPHEFYQTPVKLAKRSDIKKIIINESVTSIGDNGLSELSNLTDLVFTSAPTLSEGVFRNCGKLVNVTLPEGMTTIPYLAFYWDNTLTSIKLPSTITNIAGQAFSMTSMLKRITLPTTATVGGSAFEAFSNTYKTFVFLGAPRTFRDGELTYLDGTDTVCVPEGCIYNYPGGTRKILIPNPDYADQIDEDDLDDARAWYENDVNNWDYSPEEALEEVNSVYDYLIDGVDNPFALGEEPIEPYTLPIENGVACPGAFGGARTVVYTAADLAAANNATDKITAIGTVEFSAGCKAAIDAARAAYDALTDTQKPLVDNYDALTAAETAYANLKNQADQAAAAKVTGLIDAIGMVEYTDACKAKIDAARDAYDALTDAQKALVTNAADLAAAEDAYAALAPATDTPVYVKVTSEPEDWSGDYLIVYEGEGKALDGSTDDLNDSGNFIDVTISEGKIESNDSTDAAKVTIAPFDDGYSIKTVSGSYIGGQANVNKLVSSSDPIVNTISIVDDHAHIVSNSVVLRFNSGWPGFRYYKGNYSSQQPVQLYKLTGGAASDPDQEAADAVIDAINAIDDPVVYTDDCKDKIDAARAAYDNLTEDQQALVTNYTTLTDAETTYANLKAAADLAAAKRSAKNELLGYKDSHDYRAAQKTELANAKNDGIAAIEAATTIERVNTALAEAKAVIDAIKTDAQLTAEEIDAVIALINAIDDPVVYTDDCKAKIDAARAAYDNLTDAQKALVSNADTLTAAESTYAEEETGFVLLPFSAEGLAEGDYYFDVEMLLRNDLGEDMTDEEYAAYITANPDEYESAKADLISYLSEGKLAYNPETHTVRSRGVLVHPGDDEYEFAIACIKQVEAAPAAPQDQVSATISDKIEVNFLLDLDARTDPQTVTVAHYKLIDSTNYELIETLTFNAADLTKGDNGLYKLAIPVAPAQGADRFVLSIDGEPIAQRVYSVKDYCKYIITNGSDPTYAPYVDLATAMLEYCQAANAYFDYVPVTFAETTNAQAAIDTASGLTSTLTLDENARSYFKTVSFMALTVPEYRFYVKDNTLTEAEAAALNDKITVTGPNGVKAQFVKNVDKDGAIMLEVTGIDAEHMDEAITVTIEGVGAITFCGNDFARLLAGRNDTAVLGAALYNYGVEAKACFGA